MERRDKGNGSIFQRNDGRWVAQVTANGIRRTVYGKTEREAKSKLKELLAQAQHGALRAVTHQTVVEYIEWWLEMSRPRLKPTTHEWYGLILRTHVAAEFGRLKLAMLTPLHLTSLYARKLETLSPATVRHIHNSLRKALNDAARLDLIGTNPCLKIEPPRVEQIEPDLWNEQDIRRFVASEVTRPSRWSSLWLVLLTTGLRVGEALGLTWSCVDLDHGQLEIKQSLAFVGNTPIVMTPKSKTSQRTIAVPSIGLQALQALDSSLSEENSAEAFVFTTQMGRHPQRSDLRRRFHEACVRADVRTIRIHDLRHVSASVLVQTGADVKRIQRRMGHSSLQTTLGIYAHVLRRGDAELAEAFDMALGTSDKDRIGISSRPPLTRRIDPAFAEEGPLLH